MVKIKEPNFMKDIHKIRQRLSREWNKMTVSEILASLRDSGKWLKGQLRETAAK